MQKRTETSGNRGGRVGLLLAVLAIVGCMAIPASAGAGITPGSGMTLVFGASKAHNVADNIAVPVDCVGGTGGFCSGTVTLSHQGHHISVPFSVRGGGHEVLFVPLRLGQTKSHARKVHGVATTVQPQGPATSTKQYLFAR